MASHGADQLIVQRLLACRGLRDAQKALIGAGVLVILQFTLFLAVGVGLFAFYGGRADRAGRLRVAATRSSRRSSSEHLPPFVSAYLIAGIFSAAMCSESSALNSLASALALDIVAPLMGKKYVEGKRGLVLGKLLTLFWTIVLAGARRRLLAPAAERPGRPGRARARERDGGRPPRRASFSRSGRGRRRQTDAMIGIATSAIFMFVLWLGSKGWVPFPLGKDDRVALVLAPRLDDHVRDWLAPLAAPRHRRSAAHIPGMTPTSPA